MIAAARYLLAEYGRSRRFVAPGLMLCIGVVVLYAQAPNPVLSTAASVAALLFFVQCWLALAYFNSQSEPDRHVLAATVGGRRYVLGRMLGSFVVAGVSSLLALAYPTLGQRFERAPNLGELALILLVNLVATLAGTALAALFAQPIVRGRALAVFGLAGCALLTLPLGLPPIGATAHAMQGAHAGEVPARLSGELLGVAVFLLAVALVCARLWRRRE